MTTERSAAPPEPPSDGPLSDRFEASARETRREALRRFHEEEDLDRVYDYRMLLRLWPFVRPHRGYLVGWLVVLLVAAAFGLARPLVMREALHSFQSPAGASLLHVYGLIVAGLIVVEQGLMFPQVYWMQVAGARGMAALRRTVFTFLHGCPLAFFDRTPIGRLVTRVTNDVDAIGEMFTSGALNAVGDLIRLFAIVVIMLSIDWQMSLVAFAVVPPVALFVDWTRRRVRKAYREVRVKTARLNAFVNEQVNGVSVVQAYAQERQSEREFDRINSAYRLANTRAILLDAALDATMEMVSSICVAAILWYAGLRHWGGDVSFGTLFAFVLYIEMFFVPIRNLSARYTQIQSALAGAERVFQLLDSPERDATATESSSEQPGETDGGLVADATDRAPALELDRVTFGYQRGVTVLHDVSLSVQQGETVALVGATGSGKTTISSLLLRLYEVGSGAVRVLGRDVRRMDRRSLRQQFAVVPQDVFLFPGTIATNIAATDVEPDRERVVATLERIGALDLIERREGGIDAEVRERGQNFSAGERQLIAFARALYRDPQLLILDEPTANIDSDTEARLQLAIGALVEGRTVLVIAHRLSTARSADRIICLHRGRIAEQGTHEQLLATGGVYARLHRLQTAREAIAETSREVIAADERSVPASA